MTTDNWINLVAAILVGSGTLFLGIMAWRTIRQTKDIQKAEKRQRLLNEIIEWAIDVGKCGKRADLSDLLHIADDKQESFLPIRMTEAALNIGLMEGRNEYISTTALNFGQELQEDVDILIDCLEAYKELLEAESKGVPTAPESIEKLESHDRQLLTLARKVIEEATKIKTIDIGREENVSKEVETIASNEPTNKDIEEHLKDIKRSGRIADTKWSISLVITVWVIASNWLTDDVPSNNPLAWVIVALGLLLLLWTLYTPLISRLWQRARSKSRK